MTYIFGVFVETEGYKLFEGLGVVSLQVWWVALGDQEEHSHWVEVGMRGFPLSQLNGRDTQRPNISLRCEEKIYLCAY